MTLVTADRDLDADPATVRRAILTDLQGFFDAAGFDEVTVGDDRIGFARSLGLATISLTVAMDHDADTLVAFDAVEGLFEEMRTEYDVEARAGGSRVVARTEFTLGGALGTAFDGTLVALQRKREFADQFDYLEAVVDGPRSTTV